MKRLIVAIALAFALLIAMAIYIVRTQQGPMPAAPSYLPRSGH